MNTFIKNNGVFKPEKKVKTEVASNEGKDNPPA